VQWLEDFRCDVRRFAAAGGGSAWKNVLLQPGLWALLEYRLEAAVQRSRRPRLLTAPARVALILWSRVVQMTTGICLPSTATLGPGLHIPHAGTIVLHARTVLGRDCCLTQGVTIGISGTGERRGVPRLGDRVYVGANAVVVGPIQVGNDVVIGANSLVNRDVPDHATVVGVPAVVVNRKGSEGYL
jgi:serine O-acetyltransferase